MCPPATSSRATDAAIASATLVSSPLSATRSRPAVPGGNCPRRWLAVDDGLQQPAGGFQLLDRSADPPAFIGQVGAHLGTGRGEEAAVLGNARQHARDDARGQPRRQKGSNATYRLYIGLCV